MRYEELRRMTMTAAAGVTAAAALAAAPALGSMHKTTPKSQPTAVVADFFPPKNCEATGLQPYVTENLPSGTSQSTAQHIYAQGKPSGQATLTVGGKSYKLRYSPKTSGPQTHAKPPYVFWGFNGVKLSASQAKALVGKTATLRYTSSAGKKMKFTATVSAGKCG